MEIYLGKIKFTGEKLLEKNKERQGTKYGKLIFYSKGSHILQIKTGNHMNIKKGIYLFYS